MQKQILFVLTLSSTFIYTMEKTLTCKTDSLNEYVFSQYYPEQKLEIPVLANESETITATKAVIALKKSPQSRPICTFSYEQDTPISEAIAYALSNKKEVKRVLVIDEHATATTRGALSFLFDDKVLVHNQLPDTLWNSLYKPEYHPKLNNTDINIDLALYNVNIKNNITADERKANIVALFHHLIPTVFILPDNDDYKEKTRSLILDITALEQTYSDILNAPEPYRASRSLTESSEDSLSHSRSSSPSSHNVNPELTTSIISIKLKVARRHLQRKLNIKNSLVLDEASSSSNNNEAFEFGSTSENSGNEADTKNDDL